MDINAENDRKYQVTLPNTSDSGCYESSKNFDDFCCMFGYDNNSIKALKIYEACKKQNEKVKRLFENDITPILCIGESKDQRENTDFKAFLKEEIDTALEGLTEEQINKIIIAYIYYSIHHLFW